MRSPYPTKADERNLQFGRRVSYVPPIRVKVRVGVGVRVRFGSRENYVYFPSNVAVGRQGVDMARSTVDSGLRLSRRG